MLDIVGIGSLNLDLIAAAETINSLPKKRVRDAFRIMETEGSGGDWQQFCICQADAIP